MVSFGGEIKDEKRQTGVRHEKKNVQKIKGLVKGYLGLVRMEGGSKKGKGEEISRLTKKPLVNVQSVSGEWCCWKPPQLTIISGLREELDVSWGEQGQSWRSCWWLSEGFWRAAGGFQKEHKAQT